MLVVTSIFLSSASVCSQSLVFSFRDGGRASFLLSDIRTITYTAELLNLRKRDGSVVTWNLASIANYRYDLATGLPELMNPYVRLTIFPNPAVGNVYVRCELPVAARLSMELFDLQGRSIQRWVDRSWPAGIHQIEWQRTDRQGKKVPAGTYLLKVMTTSSVTCKKILLY